MPLSDDYRVRATYRERVALSNATIAKRVVIDASIVSYDATRDERDAIVAYAIANATNDATRARIRAIATNAFRSNDAYIARVWHEYDARNRAR